MTLLLYTFFSFYLIFSVPDLDRHFRITPLCPRPSDVAFSLSCMYGAVSWHDCRLSGFRVQWVCTICNVIMSGLQCEFNGTWAKGFRIKSAVPLLYLDQSRCVYDVPVLVGSSTLEILHYRWLKV